jgi:hypothetical protein
VANIESMWVSFDQTMARCVEHLGLDGDVTKHNRYELALVTILFRFTYKYLSIKDMHDYDAYGVMEKKTVFENTLRHLMEIRNQFNYYFNAIWC